MNLLLTAALLLFAPQAERIGAYTEELAAARKAGLPTTPADLKRPPIPESQNAAPTWRKLDAMLKVRPESVEPDEIMAALRSSKPTPRQIVRARALLAARSVELSLVHQAVSRPYCDFRRDWSQGPYLLFPEFSRMRAASRWLVGESGLMLYDGKPLDAVRNMALGFRIADQASSDTILIGYLVAVAIDAITLRGLENILYASSNAPGVAAEVQRVIDKYWKPRSLAAPLKVEIVLQGAAINLVRGKGLAELREFSGGDSSVPGRKHPREIPESEKRLVAESVDRSGAYLLNRMRHVVQTADAPYPQSNLLFAKVDAEVATLKDPRLTLVLVVFPAFAQLAATRARDIARAEVVRSAAALLAWRRNHPSFPDRLSQAMNPAPVDPFDLKPLRYRRTGNGFVVYSVGQTGTFNGEAKDKKQVNRESAFRYPAPAPLNTPDPK